MQLERKNVIKKQELLIKNPTGGYFCELQNFKKTTLVQYHNVDFLVPSWILRKRLVGIYMTKEVAWIFPSNNEPKFRILVRV